MTFEVIGEPQGKARPRFTQQGHTYTPAATKAYEQAVAWAYKAKYGTVQFCKGVPLRMDIIAYYAVPNSASKAKRADMLSGKIRPTKKPDYDNVAKIISDALNGLAFYDDAQIVDGNVTKWYGETPKVVVRIFEIK